MFAADTQVFGGGRPAGHGRASGELEVEDGSALDGLEVGGLALAAYLRSVYSALLGPVRLEGRVGRLLSFTFTEEVSHEPV